MSTFNYNENIPDGPHNPSADQPLMKTNTNSTKSIIGVDHFTFEEGNNDGFHKVVHLVNQLSDPPNDGLVKLYSKSSTTPAGANQFFVMNSVGSIFQLTGSLRTQNGYSFMNGVIVQWGIYNASGGNFSSGSTTQASSGETVITFPTPFPTNLFFFGGNLTYSQSNLPSGTGTLNVRASRLSSGPLTTMDWQVYTNTNNYTGFVWYAIGN